MLSACSICKIRFVYRLEKNILFANDLNFNIKAFVFWIKQFFKTYKVS